MIKKIRRQTLLADILHFRDRSIRNFSFDSTAMQSGRVTIKKMPKLSNKELTNYLEFFQLLNFTADLFKSFTLSGAPSLPILKEHMDLF